MFDPYDHQHECLQALTTARSSGQRKFLVVMAPGLGKTATAAFWLKDLIAQSPGRVLYVCHQRHILYTARKTFAEILDKKNKWGYLFAGKMPPSNPIYVFATFQTMARARNFFPPKYFRYVIVDEVHHAKAATFEPTVRYFQPDYALGLTATVKRSDGLDVVELFDYHPPVFDLGTAKAMARGGLVCDVDYRLLTDEIDYTKAEEAMRIGSMRIRGLNKVIFVPKRDQEVVRQIIDHTRAIANLRMLVFCESTRHANVIAKYLPNSTCIHSGFSSAENDRRMAAFTSGEVSTAVTVNMVNEGINVPEINVIVFLRTVEWYGLFLQQLGRGMRLCSGKDDLLVLDLAGNCERIKTVMALYRSVERELHRIAGGVEHTVRKPMLLTVGGVQFEEQDVKIIDLIDRIEAGYSAESLLELLQVKAAELGRSPQAREVDADPRFPQANTVKKYLGVKTWNRVLQKAGLEPITLGDMSVKELKKRIVALGFTPTCSFIDRSPDFPSVDTILQIFGVRTWNEVIMACGLKINRFSEMGVDEQKAQLAAELRAKTARLGRAPTMVEVDNDPNMRSTSNYVKVFGKPYRQILLELGLYRNSPENLARQLYELAQKLGRSPKFTDVALDPSLPAKGTFLRAFEVRTWNEVLDAAWKIINKQ